MRRGGGAGVRGEGTAKGGSHDQGEKKREEIY